MTFLNGICFPFLFGVLYPSSFGLLFPFSIRTFFHFFFQLFFNYFFLFNCGDILDSFQKKNSQAYFLDFLVPFLLSLFWVPFLFNFSSIFVQFFLLFFRSLSFLYSFLSNHCLILDFFQFYFQTENSKRYFLKKSTTKRRKVRKIVHEIYNVCKNSKVTF